MPYSLPRTLKETAARDDEAHNAEMGNSNKKIKVAHFHDIPDDSVSLIFRYAYDCEGPHALTKKGGLIENTFYLSKSMHQSVIYFLRNRIKHALDEDKAVMCKYGATPTSLRYNLTSELHMSVYLYILGKCDLSALRSITLSAYCDGIPEELEAKAIHFGIPRLDLEKDSLLTSDEFIIRVASILGRKARSLRHIYLRIDLEKLHPILLTACSATLEEIELNGEGIMDIDQIIPEFPCLRKLLLHTGNGVRIIRSKSLEELRIGCQSMVHELSCPSLKKLHIELSADKSDQEVLQYLPPLIEELSINLHSGMNDYGKPVFHCLSQTIEGLSELKTLKLLDRNYKADSFLFSRYNVEFSIRSRSLEHIDISGDKGSIFHIRKCICPSLKKFTVGCNWFRYFDDTCEAWRFRDVLGARLPDSIRPVKPFCTEDFGIYPRKDEPYSFLVGERPFIGMSVPAACIVGIQVTFADNYC